MALSYVNYDGDGSETDYNVTFPFISRSHVHVLVDGVETEDFTWLSDTQIQFDEAPDNGAEIKIQRSTPSEDRLVDFTNGAILDADDVDLDSNQLFYLIQELLEDASTPEDEENLQITRDHFDAGDDFTAGVTTELELSESPGSVDNTVVTFDGVVQHKDTYSLDGDGVTLVFSSAIPSDVSDVEVIQSPTIPYFYASLANGSVTSAKMADGNVTTSKLANSAVSTAKIADGAVTLAKLGADVLVKLMPLGVVMPYSGASAPSAEWLICDGAAVSRITYASLFALLGTTFGAGNNTTTFNLPDLRGRTPIGAGTGTGLTARTRGATVGAETHSLALAEIPEHSHTIATHGVSTTGNNSVLRVDGAPDVNRTTGNAGNNPATAHNNMQPSLVVNFIIKAL